MSGNLGAIRVGLVGYGYAGKTFHAPLIQSVPGLTLSVVGSSQRGVLGFDLPHAIVCDPDEVATHPEVDLVVIATPNDSHYRLAAAAMHAGKHVVIDKPFTVTLAEARSLAVLARHCKRLLSVFHNRRWDSEILATKAVLESGRLGDVSHYECHMDRYRPTVRERWRESAGPGAGLWYDLGPHLIDQAIYLFGLPQFVNASFATHRPGGQTEDWAHVQLIYKRSGMDHLRVILHSSLLAAGGGPRSLIHGTMGSWMKYGADVQERQLIAGMAPNDPAFGLDPNPGTFVDGATGVRSEIPAPRGDQRMYYLEIRDAILEKRAASISVKDAIAVLAILETSFASGAQEQALPLPLRQQEIAEWL